MSISIDGMMSSLIDTSSMTAAANQASSMKDSLNAVSGNSTEEELQQVCKDFASYFVEEILKEVKENMLSDEEEEGDSSLSALTDFHMDGMMETLADEVVDEVAGSFTQQLYEQMKRNYNIG